MRQYEVRQYINRYNFITKQHIAMYLHNYRYVYMVQSIYQDTFI